MKLQKVIIFAEHNGELTFKHPKPGTMMNIKFQRMVVIIHLQVLTTFTIPRMTNLVMSPDWVVAMRKSLVVPIYLRECLVGRMHRVQYEKMGLLTG